MRVVNFIVTSLTGAKYQQQKMQKSDLFRCNATMLHYQVAYPQASAAPGDGDDGNCP